MDTEGEGAMARKTGRAKYGPWVNLFNIDSVRSLINGLKSTCTEGLGGYLRSDEAVVLDVVQGDPISGDVVLIPVRVYLTSYRRWWSSKNHFTFEGFTLKNGKRTRFQIDYRYRPDSAEQFAEARIRFAM